MSRFLLVGFALGLLQGCSARLAQNDCRTYGYQAGTEAFAACTERMATLRRQNVIRALEQASPPQQASPPPRQPMTCVTTANITTCN